MTVNKDFKRLVRARMRKTGEAYTAARAQLLQKTTPAKKSAAPAKPDYAKLAGMSDAKIEAQTGCTWEKWVKSLDHNGAREMTHAQIAELCAKKYKAPSWWSQMVAVGYERIRGLRTRGQQRNGTFVWSGDVQGNWSDFSKQLPAALNFCASGIPYWNSDIGGFFSGNPAWSIRNSWRW